MVQPESRLSHQITDMIKKRGWFAFKVHGGAMMMAGLPDIVACVNGLFLGIETKLPKDEGGGDPTPRQVLVHGWITRAGGRVAVCRSVRDAENVVRGLEPIPDGVGTPVAPETLQDVLDAEGMEIVADDDHRVRIRRKQ